jgi:DNA-binding Lrp family transcriptional regulator
MSDAEDRRRQPTPPEAKALAHELRQRILRLCATEQMTNKELADRLGSDPGTVLPHVRILVAVGFLEAAPVRSGASGALEKPYRATGVTWWLSNPLGTAEPDVAFAPLRTALVEALEAGAERVATHASFLLHLTQEEVEELDRRLLDVIDEYVASDHERLDHPAHRGIVVLHRA